LKNGAPEAIALAVVDACADCEVCRFMMASECHFFDELYRLHDRAKTNGHAISPDDLRGLVDLCHYCTLCGCPDIRADIIEAKTLFAERDGLGLGPRLLEDVARLGNTCGVFPHLTNRLFANEVAARAFKRLAGVHADRPLPTLPEKSFDSWARGQGLMRKPENGADHKVAYFAGCSGRYLFPEIPRALVKIMQRHGVRVYFPEQQCCGMPTLLEGDRKKTLAFAEGNVKRLARLVADGFTIVCSCPTCGYVLKKLLKERAHYAEAYQASIGAPEDVLMVPVEGRIADTGEPVFQRYRKSIYGSILKDDGYFAPIDPLQRIAVAENTLDAGEYLNRFPRVTGVETPSAATYQRLVYFAPCHQREQDIGRPYQQMLQTLPGIDVEVVDGPYDCCGMGGIMGYKRDFHAHATRLGARVTAKVDALAPEAIVTDCLSCRLQFLHLADYPVVHPLEVLAEAAGAAG
jgi:glycerol-3-phosphate dehydrogenase subunit C